MSIGKLGSQKKDRKEAGGGHARHMSAHITVETEGARRKGKPLPADPPREARELMARLSGSFDIAPRDREQSLWILEGLCVHHAHEAIAEEFINFLKNKAILTSETDVEPFIERALVQNDMALLNHFVNENTRVSDSVRAYIRTNSNRLLNAACSPLFVEAANFLRRMLQD